MWRAHAGDVGRETGTERGGDCSGLLQLVPRGRGGELTAPSRSSAVLVRYLREDNKLHSVNLQHAHVADGQSHTVIVRLSGLRGDMLSVELYVDCKQVDSSVGLPELSEIPLAEVESIEVRTGQKAYQRMQVSAGTPAWGRVSFVPLGQAEPSVADCISSATSGVCGVHEADSGRLHEPSWGAERVSVPGR